MVAEKTSLKFRLFINLGLLVTVVSLFLFIQYSPITAEKDDTVRVSNLIESQIKNIKILRRNRQEIIMSKINETWRMQKPFTARVSQFQIDRIIEIANAKSNYAIESDEKENFGFNEPDVFVTINNQEFIFGDINKITNEQYMKTGGVVYLVAPHLGYSIPGDIEKFFSHKLLAIGEVPASITFNTWKVVQNEKGEWNVEGRLTERGNLELSQDILNQWVIGWGITSGLSSTPSDQKNTKKGIKIHTTSGKTIEFDIIKNPKGYLFVRKDEMMGFQLGEDAGNRLLDPYEIAASSQS